MTAPVRLETERLVIEPLVASDIPAFVAYRGDPEVARYQSWSADFTTSDGDALVTSQPAGLPEPGEWVQLALRALIGDETSARALIGDIAVGADAVQPSTFELGVTIAPAHQGRGYASEALRATIELLFARHEAHRVVMQGDARNESVLRLMPRLGLRHEGTILEGDWFKGEWTTLERFALLRREWLAR
jgi:RimJ/RimL family protein N-acetyltransferase